MATPDPQTAADAALGGHADAALREWLDNRQAEIERDHRDGWTGRTCHCDSPKPCAGRAYELAMVEGLRALLDARVQMVAELEQVRRDWLTQAAQLNRIAGMVGHALILRACDDATPEEVRLALARACEDVHGVIGESEATRAQRTERYLVMCASLLDDHVLRERDALIERNEEMRDERDEARDLAQVSLDILRNVSDEPMRELFGVDDMGELPDWFTRYGPVVQRSPEATEVSQ